MRSGIIAGGNWIVDRVKVIDQYPEEETLAQIFTETRHNGGAPFNVLVDLARLGAEFPLEGVGLIGSDADGSFIRATCAAHGIDTSQIKLALGASTSYTDVMTARETGKRTFFHHHGANALLDVDAFDFTATKASHFHLGYLMLLSRLDQADDSFGTRAARVLASAKSAGLTTSFDVVSGHSGQFNQVVVPALAHADIAFMNEYEVTQCTGVPLAADADEASVRVATDVLFDWGLRGVVVVHSARFAYCRRFQGEECYRASASVPPELVKGTVGAGDALAAGFLYAHLTGHDLSTCLHWGVAAAATCLLGEGASNGMLPMEESLRFACEP